MKTKKQRLNRAVSVRNTDSVAFRRMPAPLRTDTAYWIDNPNQRRAWVTVRVGEKSTAFAVAAKNSRRLPGIITEYIKKNPGDEVVISCNVSEVFLCVLGFEQ